MNNQVVREDFTQEEKQLLKKSGYQLEYHPNNLPFATKKGGYVITLNEDGSISAGYDDGEMDEVKVCESLKQAIKFLNKI
jgi:hypothetical protein